MRFFVSVIYNPKNLPIEASFSPDSQFVFAGSGNAIVHAWRVDSGVKVAELVGNHPAPVMCVQFNPKYMLLSSACINTAFWIPAFKDGFNV